MKDLTPLRNLAGEVVLDFQSIDFNYVVIMQFDGAGTDVFTVDAWWQLIGLRIDANDEMAIGTPVNLHYFVAGFSQLDRFLDQG